MTHELKTGGDRGYLRIATEEAFATREQVDVFLRMVRDGTADQGMVSLWGFYAQSPSERATQIMDRLLDLGERARFEPLHPRFERVVVGAERDERLLQLGDTRGHHSTSRARRTSSAVTASTGPSASTRTAPHGPVTLAVR